MVIDFLDVPDCDPTTRAPAFQSQAHSAMRQRNVAEQKTSSGNDDHVACESPIGPKAVFGEGDTFRHATQSTDIQQAIVKLTFPNAKSVSFKNTVRVADFRQVIDIFVSFPARKFGWKNPCSAVCNHGRVTFRKHPSKVSEIPSALDWRNYAIFLDFDGTLTPIVSTPDAVVVDPVVQTALERLQSGTGGALAIVSGRSLVDLESHLVGFDCVLSGSHGLEYTKPGGHHQTVDDASEQLAGALAEMSEFAGRNNLILESKPGAVTLHYRGKPALVEPCRRLVDRLAADDPALRAMHGNMVSEVLLTGIDKGTAVSRLMAQQPFKGRVPIMAGDDVTDEDAFVAVQRLGGFGIKVGPGATSAVYRAHDIHAFLGWLCKEAEASER